MLVKWRLLNHVSQTLLNNEKQYQKSVSCKTISIYILFAISNLVLL